MFGVLDGTWEVAFLPGTKGFHLADFGVGATTVGWNGDSGWEESVMGLRDLAPEEVAINRVQWEINFLHRLVRDEKMSELVREEDAVIDSVAHYVLNYTGSVGGEVKIYVHPETHLISRLMTSVEIPQLGLSAITTDLSGYEAFEGIKFPQQVHQVIENLWVTTTSYTGTEMNPDLPDSLFELPGK